jgi:pyruvate dehydrogenase E2 component (dihydrolipoamide acetyltransferase)
VSEERPRFGQDLPPWPQADFAAFGEIEVQPLPRLRKVAAGYFARNWVTIPHVTHHDQADVTALEALRNDPGKRSREAKLSPLPFIVKAVVETLRAYPLFNASLELAAGKIVYKKYFHIGIAVETPNGLLVPVVRDCDRKSVPQIAAEITALAERARSKGLPMADMSGGCFTVSSLGNIGGTGFTPIINAPEVAVLGVCRASWTPTRGEGDSVSWRLMLPLSLSYDHRLINGADAARFTRHLAGVLERPESLMG